MNNNDLSIDKKDLLIEKKNNSIFENWLDHMVKKGIININTKKQKLQVFKAIDTCSVETMKVYLKNKRESNQISRSTYNNYIFTLRAFRKALIMEDPENILIRAIENLKLIKNTDRSIYYSLPWDVYQILDRNYPREFKTLGEFVKILILSHVQGDKTRFISHEESAPQTTNYKSETILKRVHELKSETDQISSVVTKFSPIVKDRLNNANLAIGRSGVKTY